MSLLEKSVNTIRFLAIDAMEKANSGPTQAPYLNSKPLVQNNVEFLCGMEKGVVPAAVAPSSPPAPIPEQFQRQIERVHLLQEANKKPPGLSQEVLDCLSTDIFSSAEVGVDGLVLKASGDCTICLESFTDGDKLICLPCEHRFHAACLSPWALIRGDCPYCRRVIVVDGQNAKRTT
ncbi:E3 ubiquitin-protein ligase HIP1 [Pyrus ussuriensis x Pyrus communis]|uniref:E3 ubiquitin-protein ligase HIP1 n=1 Tax=Pyrus ussuriensis x Pyrus communis TaxID=2448454 RepID=A0A5N5FU51_9ROSA|nr:E3 ubiquitin-protein ligase HIP1 [Pyrus ussuriensis x Pyrus communis]